MSPSLIKKIKRVGQSAINFFMGKISRPKKWQRLDAPHVTPMWATTDTIKKALLKCLVPVLNLVSDCINLNLIGTSRCFHCIRCDSYSSTWEGTGSPCEDERLGPIDCVASPTPSRLRLLLRIKNAHHYPTDCIHAQG